MVDLALFSGMSGRKTAVLTMLLTAGMVYDCDLDALIITKEKIQEESVLVLSRFIKYNKKDKLKFLKTVKLELLLKSVIKEAKAKQFINMCLNNSNKLLQILSRVKLQYIVTGRGIFKHILNSIISRKYPIITLNDLGRALNEYKYKIQEFISKYALIITTAQNSENRILVVESIRGRSKPSEMKCMKKAAGFLANRSDNMLTITDIGEDEPETTK